jgi:hypothetical protein
MMEVARHPAVESAAQQWSNAEPGTERHHKERPYGKS